MAVDCDTDSDPGNTEDFVEAVTIAGVLYSAAELAAWLTSPQPLLDNWTPMQLLACGKARHLRRVMDALSEGTYL